MAKVRIDVYLVENGYFETREKAKRNIMAGLVLVNNTPVHKAGENFKEEDIKEVRIKGDACPYVSRGGLKLAKAIKRWNLEFKGKQMLDVGSSTGGFTDCALQHGAEHVCALDVGTNQLVYKLRVDERVSVFEKTNFRTISDDFFKQEFDYITMDVSFISTSLLMENVAKNLKTEGKFICLIKPQFEAGKDEKRNAKGVITDRHIHKKVIDNFIINAQEHGLYLNKLTTSPIKGGSGNREFLGLLSKDNQNVVSEKTIKQVVYQG